jgi:hypothetical protein
MPVPESYLNQRQRIRVALLLFFKLQEVPVSAPFGVGKLSAGARTSVVDATLPGSQIEKGTSLAEEWIRLPAQDPFFVYYLRVASGGKLFGYAKMFRQPKNVTPVDLHTLVDRAAISRTFVAIVIGAAVGSHLYK